MTVEYLMALVRALLQYMGAWDVVTTSVTLVVIISTAKIVLDKLRS